MKSQSNFLNHSYYEQSQAYKIKSQQYALKGELQTAISNLSKSLLLYPNFETYVERGKLYASSSKFVNALKDFEEADLLYKEKQNNDLINERSQEINARTIEFLQKSIIIKNLPELKEVAKKQEIESHNMPFQLNEEFKKIMVQLINANQQQKYNQLLSIVKKQQKRIQQLEGNLKINYQEFFYAQMDSSTLSLSNKEKCIVYYNTLLSQMEEYYLAAKVLHDMDENKLKFEDYQWQKGDKVNGSKNFIQKVFKVFEKNSSKMERVGDIVKEIPYIGTTFKIIKSASKGFSWFQGIKVQSECDNILALRPNVSSFNTFASHFGYELYKNHKVLITMPNSNTQTFYEYTQWEKLRKGYKNFRRKQIAAQIHNNLTQVEKDNIYEMAQMHASIFMVGVGYGFFKLPYGCTFPTQEQLQKIMSRMSEVEKQLMKKIDKEDETQSGTKNWKGKTCGIY